MSRNLFTSFEWPVTISPLMATRSGFSSISDPMIVANGSSLRNMPQ